MLLFFLPDMLLLLQGKIAKDARECVQECVSEFISFITSEASDRCQAEKRKTINGEDILFAMSTLGFDNYVEPLKVYLQKYREHMKNGDKSADGFDDINDVLRKILLQHFYLLVLQRTNFNVCTESLVS